MIQCSLSRFTTWPGAPTEKRKFGSFQVDHTRLLEDLSDELSRVRAANVELGMDIPEKALRNARRSFDGWPRADVSPTSPGVILRFDRGKRHMQFACDQYANWKHNLRAIGLTLEALRAVARYGATTSDQQYRGYERQIAAAPSETQNDRDRSAAKVIVSGAGIGDVATVLSDRDTFGEVFRQASARVIATFGADSEQLRALNFAAEIVKARFRG